MKRLITALLVCALALMPVSVNASWFRPTLTDYVRWAGCNASVVTSDAHSAVESFYNPLAHTIYIGTKPDEPEYVRLTVLLHEAAHCLQTQDGTIWRMETVERELDADTQSANIQCAVLHIDGAKNVHDTFVWAYKTFGYEGDYAHGTLAERITAGYSAPACQQTSVQGL